MNTARNKDPSIFRGNTKWGAILEECYLWDRKLFVNFLFFSLSEAMESLKE
jgi:hypothetical protein